MVVSKVQAALPNPYPVASILEALEAWQRNPSAIRLDRIRDSLASLISATGCLGGYLECEAPPLPRLNVGVGSLQRRPSAARRARLRAAVIRVDDGRVSAGHLWLDADPSAEPSTPAGERERAAVRALEVGLEGAWALATARQATEQLEALDAATRAIAGILSLDRVLQVICDRVRDLVSAEYAALGITDTAGNMERIVASGLSRAARDRIGPSPTGHGLLGVIVREGVSLRSSDVASDPRATGFPPAHPPMRAFLGVPITVKGRPVGNLYMGNKRGAREFTPADQAMVEMFARHAAIAIENARLHEQVQRMAVVEERERIGKDLHDGIIQGLYGLGLSLEDVPELMDDDADEARARVDRAIEGLHLAIADIRNFIFGLRQDLLEEIGLVGGIAAIADEFRINSVTDIEFTADDVDDLAFTPEPTLQVLQIVRESVSNIARHAKATRAGLAIRRVGNDRLVIEIADNGRGFVTDQPRGPEHQGLGNMRARALSLGGRLDVHSQPGAGTRIILTIPISGGG